ncbi:MAG TPA: AbrB/MazE/SpoVT family DNA-binding domain-containing protein [Solirubrobacteraceae bacterium]|nr:AbrB/MazE/SpoVT family DNA-binding domain-containing protein [Solirubrobacteraceae bacterium]
MRATIDAAGRIVVPKRLRDDLGFAAGQELELDAVNGRLEVSHPAAQTRIEYVGGRPVIRYPEDPPPFGVDEVRQVLEQVRMRR